MAEAPVLKLENVWKIYQLGKVEVQALKAINLTLPRGSFLSIMGPSGSGKSSLLHIIGALDKPSKGRVFLSGEDVSTLSENQLARIRGRKIGFVFQQFNLLPNLNALENVMLPMVFQGLSEQERKNRAMELLSFVGLKDRANHKPSELSGGERQRVAIARALANNPEIIVADEPTGNLDSSTGKKIMEILTDLHKNKGKTIIVVTHDPYIARYSEKIINLLDGQVVKDHKAAAKTLWQENNKSHSEINPEINR